MKTLIAATIYMCLGQGVNNVCQHKEVYLDRDTCKTGIIEQNFPKGSEFNKVKVATVCKG